MSARRTTARSLLVALLCATFLAGFAGTAEAVRPWPGGRITYVDKTKDPEAVRAAVDLWNDSGVRVRFKKVRKPSKARLVIRNSKNVPSGCGSGLATLGHVSRGKAFVNILHGSDAEGQACSVPGQTLVVAHELGHVLGLEHNDRGCSVMNSTGTNGVAPSGCLDGSTDAAKPGRWRCRVLEKVDLKRAAKMYGGRPRVREQEWCDAIQRIPAGGPITWAPTAYGTPAVTLTRAAEPAVPGWLGTWGFGAPGYELHATPNACTAVPGDDATVYEMRTWDEIPVGGTKLSYLSDLAPGSYCLSMWQFDRGTNYSAQPSTLMVQVG